jgi:hypothetical protein
MNTPRPSARLRCVPALGALLGALLGASPSPRPRAASPCVCPSRRGAW